MYKSHLKTVDEKQRSLQNVQKGVSNLYVDRGSEFSRFRIGLVRGVRPSGRWKSPGSSTLGLCSSPFGVRGKGTFNGHTGGGGRGGSCHSRVRPGRPVALTTAGVDQYSGRPVALTTAGVDQ